LLTILGVGVTREVIKQGFIVTVKLTISAGKLG